MFLMIRPSISRNDLSGGDLPLHSSHKRACVASHRVGQSGVCVRDLRNLRRTRTHFKPSTRRLACVPWFHGTDNLLVRQPSEMSDEHNLGLTDWWCVRRWSATSLDSEL
ncbi:hypothetical protein BDV12DRAFT_104910 [Aspergillus spectabilis]